MSGAGGYLPHKVMLVREIHIDGTIVVLFGQEFQKCGNPLLHIFLNVYEFTCYDNEINEEAAKEVVLPSYVTNVGQSHMILRTRTSITMPVVNINTVSYTHLTLPTTPYV